jgi:leader peptidase (prepilin peptidase) / N-methyltransferase
MIVIKILASIITGWICGVIINYLSDTLPVYRRFRPPFCDECKQNISLINYIFGRPCRSCLHPVKARFWMVNIISIVLVLFITFYKGNNILTPVFDLIIYLFLLLITIIDIEHHLVLNSTSLAGVFILGAIGMISHGWRSTFIGGAAGFGIMLILYFLGRIYSKNIARKRGLEIDEGMGFGDVSLSGVCGLLLGWPGIVGGLFIGVILGGIWSLIIIIRAMLRRKEKPLLEYIAYAPFITLATAGLWLFR